MTTELPPDEGNWRGEGVQGEESSWYCLAQTQPCRFGFSFLSLTNSTLELLLKKISHRPLPPHQLARTIIYS